MKQGRLTAWSNFGWTTGNDPSISHQRRIDSGGFGEVHEMLDLKTSMPFARKLVRPFGGHTEEGLHNELRALEKICTLNNRNIVSVLSHGYLPQSIYYYIDMELCDLNLEEFIKKKWPTHVLGKSRYFTSAAYDSSIVWAIMEDLACGLAFIHSLREVHRDLKPRNVLYSLRQDVWKLADFDAASEGTSKGVLETVYSKGTPSYRAPELLSEPSFYNNKSDIWALGCILYEIATATKAFASDWAVSQHVASNAQLVIPSSRYGSPAIEDSAKDDIERMVQSMVEINQALRPSADRLRELFAEFSNCGLLAQIKSTVSCSPEQPAPPLGLIPMSRSPRFVICCSRNPHVICIDQWVTVWDALSGEKIRQYRGSNITVFAISSDDRYFAAANNSILNIWDLRSDTESFEKELSDTITSLAFAPSVWWIACGKSDHKIRILKIESGGLQRFASLRHSGIYGPPKHLEATDSHLIARYNTHVAVWDVTRGVIVKNFQIHASLLHMSFNRLDPSCHYILDVMAYPDKRQTITIRDSKTSEPIGTIHSPDPVDLARFSRCGGYVISGHFRLTHASPIFRVWDARTTKLIHTLNDANSVSWEAGSGQVYMSPSRKFVLALPTNLGGVSIRLWKLELPATEKIQLVLTGVGHIEADALPAVAQILSYSGLTITVLNQQFTVVLLAEKGVCDNLA